METIKKSTFQSLEALKTQEAAQTYLRKALESFTNSDDAKIFLTALRNLTKAQGGMTALSRKTGINRQNLYRSFASTGNPKLKSLSKILKGFGFQLTVEPIKRDIPAKQDIDHAIDQILADAADESEEEVV